MSISGNGKLIPGFMTIDIGLIKLPLVVIWQQGE